MSEQETFFEALRADHEKQRTLARILVKTSGDSRGRRELFTRLKDALEKHERAEERCLYGPMFDHDLTQEKARHSVAEHHELDELIRLLDEREFDNTAWLHHAKELHDRLTHHLREEEREVFQIAGKIVPPEKQHALAAKYHKLMNV